MSLAFSGDCTSPVADPPPNVVLIDLKGSAQPLKWWYSGIAFSTRCRISSSELTTSIAPGLATATDEVFGWAADMVTSEVRPRNYRRRLQRAAPLILQIHWSSSVTLIQTLRRHLAQAGKSPTGEACSSDQLSVGEGTQFFRQAWVQLDNPE